MGSPHSKKPLVVSWPHTYSCYIVISIVDVVNVYIDSQPLVVVACLLCGQNRHETVVPDAGISIHDVRAQRRVNVFRFKLRQALL